MTIPSNPNLRGSHGHEDLYFITPGHLFFVYLNISKSSAFYEVLSLIE